MNKPDTIFTRGFLSTQVEEFRQGYRQHYADLFAICEEKAETATARLFDADFSAFNDGKDRHVLLGLGFWCRCVRACQGALVLLERGMVPEAQILIRSAYEFLFVGAASITDKSVLDQLIAKDQAERKKQANDMLKDCPALTSDGIDKLREIIERDSEGVGAAFNAFNAAQKTGLKELYATVYRGMSLIASHATIAATNSVFEWRGDELIMTFGPTDEQLDFSIGLVDKCLAEGMERFHPLMPPREGTASAQAA